MKLSDIAKALEARLVGDGTIEVTRVVHPVDARSPGDLALAMDKKLLQTLEQSQARIAVLADDESIAKDRLDGYIVVARPRYAMAGLTDKFATPVHASDGIHSSAVVESDASIASGVSIGPLTYVAAGARIASGVTIMSNVTIGAGASIGSDSLIHAGVRIGERVEIGARAIIHHNASIGADGFSFVTPHEGAAEEAKRGMTDAVTAQNVSLVRINSVGTVIVGNDVEVGACTSIDRGTVSATRIGDNTKIDDLVMIGHNVIIGDTCMICGQVGIAGSAKVGSRVVLAGQVGVGDHITIGDDVVVGARSAVGMDLPSGMVAVGTPAVAKTKATEIYMYTRRLKGLFDEVARLKNRLKAIESRKKKG